MTPLVVLAVALAVAAPEATPAPVSTDLPEIGRVRSKTLCQRISDDARSTIAATLRNNYDLDGALGVMRGATKESFANPLRRFTTQRAIERWPIDMYYSLKAAREQLDDLRRLGDEVTEPTLKSEITAYVDALDYVHGEQAKIQRRILTATGIDASRRTLADGSGPPDANSAYSAPQGEKGDILSASVFSRAVTELSARLPAIAAREDRAAGHVDTLLAACAFAPPTPRP